MVSHFCTTCHQKFAFQSHIDTHMMTNVNSVNHGNLTMTTKSTLIITAVFNPDNMASAQEYMQRAISLLVKAGGEIVRRVKVERAILGEQNYHACLVMDFPTSNAVDTVFNSSEYAEIIPLRELGFKAMTIVIANSM